MTTYLYAYFFTVLESFHYIKYYFYFCSYPTLLNSYTFSEYIFSKNKKHKQYQVLDFKLGIETIGFTAIWFFYLCL